MRTLPHKIRKNDFDYVQVLRGGGYTIYRQMVSQNEHYYELFKIQIRPEQEFRGELLEAREAFPHNEAFGSWAWTYDSLEKAMGAMFTKQGISHNF